MEVQVDYREVIKNKYNAFKNKYTQMQDLHVLVMMTDWTITLVINHDNSYVLSYEPPKRETHGGWELDSYDLIIYEDADNHLRLIRTTVDWLIYREFDIASTYKNGAEGTIQILYTLIESW